MGIALRSGMSMPEMLSDAEHPSRVAIGRIRDAVSRWRVVVETWAENADEYRGRVIFQTDEDPAHPACREGPPLLHGRTQAEVMSSAYELTEDRLRTLLRSLS